MPAACMKDAICMPDRSLRDLGLRTSSGFKVGEGSTLRSTLMT